MLNDSREAVENIYLQDKSAAFNTARIEALEMQNLFEVAEATAITANERKESRGAHAREDFPKRDDVNYMKHTLSWHNGKEVKINYRPVTLSTMSNDVQSFPPKERIY